ncbi:ATP-dependent DNA helicase yku80 [Stygiomarasmius scandens]|uniref:ATP-dependent DNA helicase II subunit 2 n=1 Tax=Marasmiellus scandens TaxID=2682957 RepID=A0ABR1K1I9_9AGAR
MPAERAGYTVHMFVLDVCKSMGSPHTFTLPDGRTQEITNLQWALKYIKLKIQEMIYNGRKTDKCGVIIFGTEETNNIVNDKQGGYDNVTEYIPICTPNAGTLRKLDRLEPSATYGDPIDALIVATKTQEEWLGKKKWSKKITLVTDGQNIMELEDWESSVAKLNELEISFLLVGVDFDSDDPEYEYQEPDKSNVKRQNEQFWREFLDRVDNGNMGTLGHAMLYLSKPSIKETASNPMRSVLRIGDAEGKPDQAIEIDISTTKCTAVANNKAWKNFAVRMKEGTKDEEEILIGEDGSRLIVYAQLKKQAGWYVDTKEENDDDDDKKSIKKEDGDGDVKMEEDSDSETLVQVEKENLIRGYKYGTGYVPCADDSFLRLETKKGIDIIGFFDAAKFRRELSRGEVQYIWGDKDSPLQQVALSSIARGMAKKKVMAIARWVTKDGSDAKMGVLNPCLFDKVDCLLWAEMPFADDYRQYTFASLERLVTKKGEVLTEHPYLPTEEQCEAMDQFVKAMDLMKADKDPETGKHTEWFTPIESYNPGLHRVKQAMFHCAVVDDLATEPLDPPHPDTTKYFEPPPKVVKKSKEVVEDLIKKMNVKEVVKQPKRTRNEEHVHAADDDDEPLLLARKPTATFSMSQIPASQPTSPTKSKPEPKPKVEPGDSETEDESDDDTARKLAMKKAPSSSSKNPLPTPARSLSPRSHSVSQANIQSPAKPKQDDIAMDIDADIDPQRDPGRVIGRTRPLDDFKKIIEDPESYPSAKAKAMKDLGHVVTGIVLAPFASRREQELKDCLKEMRRAALLEDEVDVWNGFIQDLKDKCLFSTPGNKEFWEVTKKMGSGLITGVEARKLGADSDVGEDQAVEFLK